jgi:succinate dehydrogenase / fumarate reductase iron-sulfur subunit
MSAESSSKNISVTLRVWRQAGPDQPGRFVEYRARDLNPNMSLLEMLDVVNDELTLKGEEPIAFAHDCREGICGTCSLMIDGKPHGPHRGVASCQTYMRSFADGAVITIEPFRATPFPLIKDLIVDRSAFDKIQQAGGFISVRTGAAARRQLDPRSEGRRRAGDGRRGLHRLRRLRGRVQERLRDALRRGQGFAVLAAPPGPART